MPERIRRNRGLARPGKPGSGALPARATRTAREGRRQQPQSPSSLLGNNSVAERGELRRAPEARGGGDPAGIEALHPLHELRAEPTGRIGGRGRGTGEPLPSGDGGCVRPPSPASSSGDSSAQSGRTTIGREGRRSFPVRRSDVPVPPALGSDAAALGRVMSPLPCRWFGEPLIPSEAFGVGSSHSTSSARFGPCPPLFLFAGCWEPPFLPMLLVGVFNRVAGGPGGEEGPLAAVRGPDVGGAKHEPLRVVPEVGQGSEYGTECSQRRLTCGVSQTPRAGFHVARGTGGGGEEAAHILDHNQAGLEGRDRTGDVQPQPGAGLGVESGPAAGDRDVFDRGSRPSGRTPGGRWTSRRP
ncbi:hypothetical protein K373_02130 [Streptomyces sp. DvalAA-21]|nr:hypothetical protein SACTE_2933 [Streptomyces sp. SirexAA-E]PZX41901.1 hypothetical protein K373_02130 [Streptomyces sp. DvalAA-21]RAJ38298.1 hypothetical protein K351_01877 [Streptomyces sp. DpondAA-E10]RAJ52146.1 hypothetical protein K352_01273 [Streptomyces sp. DpondAA-A50]SCD70434.1 hypothetical protein GA0115235_106119 [Streptomyces sp. DpondAA-F4a]SCM13650.1 hypothetical protein SAMN04883147_109720 [Streptomyces sp. DpondAA-F4]